MHVRILYFDGCPHWESTRDLVRRVAAAYDAVVQTVAVTSDEDAVQNRFLGSPTVHIDGRDIDPSARGRTDFTLACRVYGPLGSPPAEMIASALREAAS